MSNEEPEPVEESLDEAIARRAYEISQSVESGSDVDNWLRAERELTGHEEEAEEEAEPVRAG